MIEGTWPKDCIQRAFVEGAKWWQFQRESSTMFPSERAEAEAEAVKRYGEPKQEVPEAIQDLLIQRDDIYTPRDHEQNSSVLEAYRRGQKTGSKQEVKTEQEFYHSDPIIETMNRRMAEYSDWVHKDLQNLFDNKPLEPRLEWDKPGRKVFTYADRRMK